MNFENQHQEETHQRVGHYLAFFEERSFLLGATYIGADSDFSGSGAVTGVTAEQESIQEIPPLS